MSYAACLDAAISTTSSQGNTNTDSCGGVSLPDDILVTFTCTPTPLLYVPVGQVGGADGHISFLLGHPGCPTMPCNGMSLSR